MRLHLRLGGKGGASLRWLWWVAVGQRAVIFVFRVSLADLAPPPRPPLQQDGAPPAARPCAHQLDPPGGVHALAAVPRPVRARVRRRGRCVPAQALDAAPRKGVGAALAGSSPGAAEGAAPNPAAGPAGGWRSPAARRRLARDGGAKGAPPLTSYPDADAPAACAGTEEKSDGRSIRRSLNQTGRYTRQPKDDPTSDALMETHGVGYSSTGLVAQMRDNNNLWQQGDMTVKLAKAYGYCWGVERAVRMAYEARNAFPEKKIYITNEIIHNPEVNQVRRGAPGEGLGVGGAGGGRGGRGGPEGGGQAGGICHAGERHVLGGPNPAPPLAHTPPQHNAATANLRRSACASSTSRSWRSSRARGRTTRASRAGTWSSSPRSG